MPSFTRRHALMGLALLLLAGLLAATHADAVVHFAQLLASKLTVEKFLRQVANVSLLSLGLAALALTIELAAVGWQASSLRRLLVRTTASSRVDLLMFALVQLNVTRILAIMLSFLTFSVVAPHGHGVLAARLGIARFTSVSSPLLGFLACTLVASLAQYWVHRAQHMSVLWPMHRLHHSARDMTCVTAFRDNIFADLIIGPLSGLPLSLLVLPENSILTYQVAASLQDLLVHSAWVSGWGWAGLFIVSPLYHRLHHSVDGADLNRNFSNILPLWDRLFGTYKAPGDAPITIGIDHAGYDSVAGAARRMVLDVLEALALLLRFGRPLRAPAAPTAAAE
jgi:sterol desaturase/sphingolipid hydroxylase (fatty acid hydroxylase superfamily)